MSTSQRSADRESLILRAIWMLVFFFVWQVAELVLLVVVVAQLVLHAVNGKANESLQRLGDSLSQYVAQIGRFGTFNTDRKPWPMSDWPKPRPADRETPPPVTPVSPEQEPQP
ncbi:DUF4389 domain-containing protein [Pseudomonas sp. Q2-TVG4-2]|jgi:hypothetical protein|uniref:DUF4389 domain-containing protein n=1 Tax=Pseudomonas sp. Q2-TVG4-2 TaxID=1685699 RepID=UPI0015E7029A|nr:DUF4389 domain-containing protein [Pseudomonas sp. Q2-TVG4-2]